MRSAGILWKSSNGCWGWLKCVPTTAASSPSSIAGLMKARLTSRLTLHLSQRKLKPLKMLPQPLNLKSKNMYSIWAFRERGCGWRRGLCNSCGSYHWLGPSGKKKDSWQNRCTWSITLLILLDPFFSFFLF